MVRTGEEIIGNSTIPYPALGTCTSSNIIAISVSLVIAVINGVSISRGISPTVPTRAGPSACTGIGSTISVRAVRAQYSNARGAPSLESFLPLPPCLPLHLSFSCHVIQVIAVERRH